MTTATAVKTDLETQYAETFRASKLLYERAVAVLPNGVTHDSRIANPFPVYVHEAAGSKKQTVDGTELIDYWVGHGALLLGHGRPEVIEAARKQAEQGTHLGACHELEIEWAELVCDMVPGADRVRFTNSGTEASLMALRLARAATGRNKIIKFNGHFHGWHDHTEHAVDPPYDEPMSPGILEEIAAQVICLPAGDLSAVENAILSDGDVAAVILEPTGGCFGAVPVLPDFVKGLSELTARLNTLLIFDEVVTGFRVSPGGVQEVLGVKPDMTLLAKVVAGGFPGGALAGRKDVMLGALEFGEGGRARKMHHPGTFNGNPVSAAAGITTLKIIRSGEDIEKANRLARTLRDEINSIFRTRGIPGTCYGQYSDFNINLFPDVPQAGAGLEEIVRFDHEKLRPGAPTPIPDRFRMAMMLNGVDLPKMRGLTSSAHTDEDIERTVSAIENALEEVVMRNA